MFRGRPPWNIRFSMTQPGLHPTYNPLAPSSCVEAISGTKTPAPGSAFSKSIVLIS